MAHGTAPADAVDPKATFSNKYKGEATEVAKLLEQNNTDEAVKRLQLDSHLKPHEFHNFMKQVQAAYAEDKSKNNDLPNVHFADEKVGGIRVAVDKEGQPQTDVIFQVKPEELAKRGEKPIPMTGDLLGLTKEQTTQILDIQKKEKADGKGTHKFGDIAVSLGMKTPDEVNAALDQQDHLRAKQLADDVSKGMPLGRNEGYFQMLKRTHPELADETASKFAHKMLKLNHNNIHLKEGSELPVLSEKQRAETEATAYADIHKRTGQVKAKAGQPLSEIPPG
jgi:hypothetical protein